MPLRLHNTLTRRLEDFSPADPARVTFYSCGPTVYDDAHIGNFRSFLAADLLRRWLESPLCEVRDPRGSVHQGPRKVIHVMNITDVGHMTDDAEGGEAGEDRMELAGRRIAEAKKAGKLPAEVSVDPRDPYAIARFYEDRFREDARALGLQVTLDADKDPTLHPRASDNVPGMIAVIERLVERGYAYVVGVGVGEPGRRVVYFDVQKFAPYGALSGNSLEKLREGEGGRISAVNQADKHHPADFLLWKEDPSHIMKWKSPWGDGYPGWHIECTVMSAGRLAVDGPGALGRLLAHSAPKDALIDLHSGGEDNIFPHHECEIAQSCCAFAASGFARLWFHARFLLVNGDKMSKSKGNFFTARDLFARGYEPAAVRLALINTHYRTNANFTEQGLKDCQKMIDRWRRALDEGSAPAAPADGPSAARAEKARAAFAEALHDDLNIARAIAVINEFVGGLDRATAADARFLREADAVLAVMEHGRVRAVTSELGLWAPGLTPDPAVEDLLRLRQAARANKDFKASDAIRDRLLAMGFAIKDMPGGKVEVRRA